MILVGLIGGRFMVHDYITLVLGLGPGWLVAGSVVVVLVMVGVERLRG